MKLLLSTLIIICSICPAFAQNALFPELTSINKNENTPPKVQQDAIQNTENQKNKNTLNNQQNTNTEKSEMDTGNLRLVVASADRIAPTMRNFSYCTAEIRLENGTSQVLQNLKVLLNYSPLSTGIAFSGVAKNQSQTTKITLVGESCDNILNQPTIEVQSCKITNMSEEDCKKRVEFVPFS